MRVEILEVDGDRVAFATDYGTAVAGWHGPAPDVGRVYYVELSTHDPLEWGRDIVALPGGPLRVAALGEGVVIDALLEHLDASYDHAVLRIGPSIFMLTVTGQPPPLGSWVRLQLATLTLYDTKI
jgi:hypothetical protein